MRESARLNLPRVQCTASEQSRRQTEAARQLAHLRRHHLVDFLRRLIEGSRDEILQHLDIFWVDSSRVDRQGLNLLLTVHDDLDSAAASRDVDGLALELVLHLLHLVLHIDLCRGLLLR